MLGPDVCLWCGRAMARWHASIWGAAVASWLPLARIVKMLVALPLFGNRAK